MTITVNPGVVANADSYRDVEGTTLTIAAAQGVLANDTSMNGGTLTATLVNGTANGKVTLNADGSFSYTPNAGFTGPDSFTYTAASGLAVSAPATVTITVLPPISAVSLSVTPNSPVLVGTQLTLSAAVTGGNVPQYEFYALYPVNGVNQQVMIQPYALSNTCTWTPTLAATYTIVVCARENGSTVTETAYNTVSGYLVKPIPVPTITSFTPSSGYTGSVITITGTNFTGATAVAFGGVAATSFTVVNATTITATVGSGAAGTISVTTAYGTARQHELYLRTADYRGVAQRHSEIPGGGRHAGDLECRRHRRQRAPI